MKNIQNILTAAVIVRFASKRRLAAKVLAFTLVSVLFLPAAAFGSDLTMYCAASGGSDTYPYDTPAKAFNGVASISDKIAEVNSGVQAGANYNLVAMTHRITVLFADGTYSGNTMSISSSFTTSKAYYINLKADTGAAPVISTSGVDAVDVYANNTCIQGLSITAASSIGVYFTKPLLNSSLIYCNIYGSSTGVYFDGTLFCSAYDNLCSIKHSYIHNNSYGFWNYKTNYNTTFDNVSFYGNTSYAIYSQFAGVSASMPGGVIKNCRVYNNKNGFYLGLGGDSALMPTTIKNNIFYQNDGAYPTAYALYFPSSAWYVNIINNTFYNHGAYAIQFYSTGAAYNFCNNNIFCIPNTATSYGIICYPSCFLACDYNDFYLMGAGAGKCGKYNAGDYQTLSEWQGSGSGYDANSISADPLFASIVSGNEDFHLKSTAGRWTGSGWTTDAVNSPCIDAGDPSSSYFLEPAPNGGRVNQGAYGNTQYASKTPAGIPAGSPTALLCEGGVSSSTLTVFDCMPEFSAVTSGGAATHAEVMVSADNSYWSNPLWDSGPYDIGDITDSTRCRDIEYGTNDPGFTPLSPDTTYYWRISFYDTGMQSGWAYGRFMTGDEFGHYRIYCKPSGGGNAWPYGSASDAYNGLAAINDIIAALNGDNNNNNAIVPHNSSYNLVNRTNRFTVILADGSYNNGLYVSTVFAGSNASELYFITVRNYAGAAPIINVDLSNSFCVFAGADWTRIIGLTANGSGHDAFIALGRSRVWFEACNASEANYGFNIGSGSSGVELFNCTAYKCSRGIILFSEGIANCMIRNCRVTQNLLNGITFQVNGATDIDNCQIRDCIIDNNAYNGVEIGINGTNNVDNCVISGNAIYSNQQRGIRLRYIGNTGKIRDCVISGFNKIYNNGTGGVFAGIDVDGNAAVGANPTIIRNNIIYDADNSQDYGVYLMGAVGQYVHVVNNTFYNNRCAIYEEAGSGENFCNNNIICVQNGGYGIYCNDMSPFSSCDYNDIYLLGSGNVGFWGDNKADLAAWRVSGYDAYSMSADPLFVNASATPPDFHLKSTGGHWNVIASSWVNDSQTSPCIDEGDLSGDFRNEPEPNGGRLNLGAYGNTAEASKSVVNPNKPSVLYSNNTADTAQVGRVNPTDLTDFTPNMSAIYNDDNLSSVALAAQVQVGADTDWNTIEKWNSPWIYFTIATPIPGERIPDVIYNGASLSNNVTYYWRVRIRTNANCATDWSDAAYFRVHVISMPDQATNPTPADGATGVSLTPTLSWDPANGATGYTIYFGTSSTPPVAGNSAGTSYPPGTLTADTTYFWHVDAFNEDGFTDGALWFFVTGGMPSKALNPDPANDADNVPVDQILHWDAAVGADKYVVYLGLSPTALTNIGEITPTLYAPGRLNYKARYYWRVDSVNSAGTTTGDLWTFRTEEGILKKHRGGCSCDLPGDEPYTEKDFAGYMMPILIFLLLYFALRRRVA
jgi:hypothetical protein